MHLGAAWMLLPAPFLTLGATAMNNSKKNVTSPRTWIVGALAFVALGVAVGLQAASRMRKAACARMLPRYSRNDSDAISRMEGEGGPIIGLPQAHSEGPGRG